MLPERYPIFWDAVRRVVVQYPQSNGPIRILPYLLIVLAIMPLFLMGAGGIDAVSFWAGTMQIQEYLLLLVAPLLAVGAFTAERERRSLDMLFLTPQSTRAILWQKYAVACLPLYLGLTCFFPFVLHSLIWWPIPWHILAINYLLIVAEGAAAVALALLASCLARHTRVALLASYGLLVLLVVWGRPVVTETLWPICLDALPPRLQAWCSGPLSPMLLAGLLLLGCTAVMLWGCQFVLDRERTPAGERFRPHTSRRAAQRPASLYWYLPDKQPIFWDDLRRRLRGRRTFDVMLACALLMCAVPVCLYSWQPPGTSPETWPALGREMFWSAIVGQLVLVFLVCPGLTALTFSSEREARRMDFLLLSGLTMRELVMGKFYGAIALQGLLLLCGMPVMAIIAATFGGISPWELLIGYAGIITLGLFFASTALHQSCLAKNSTTALLHGYLYAFMSFIGLMFFSAWCLCGIGPLLSVLSIRNPETGWIAQIFIPAIIVTRSNLKYAIHRMEKWREEERAAIFRPPEQMGIGQRYFPPPPKG